MITVELTADHCGRFCSCNAFGHAGAGPLGRDPVCAAVSVLLRTALEQLSGFSGVVLESVAEKRGVLSFSVVSFPEDAGQFLEYTVSFLVTGIGSVAREYPEYVMLQMHTRDSGIC